MERAEGASAVLDAIPGGSCVRVSSQTRALPLTPAPYAPPSAHARPVSGGSHFMTVRTAVGLLLAFIVAVVEATQVAGGQLGWLFGGVVSAVQQGLSAGHVVSAVGIAVGAAVIARQQAELSAAKRQIAELSRRQNAGVAMIPNTTDASDPDAPGRRQGPIDPLAPEITAVTPTSPDGPAAALEVSLLDTAVLDDDLVAAAVGGCLGGGGSASASIDGDAHDIDADADADADTPVIMRDVYAVMLQAAARSVLAQRAARDAAAVRVLQGFGVAYRARRRAAAAVCIQRAVRRWRRARAGAVLQRVCRAGAARRRVHRSHAVRAARRLKYRMSTPQDVRKQQQHARRRQHAARTIQTAVRGYLRRCELYRELAPVLIINPLGGAYVAALRVAAARRLQEVVREFLARRRRQPQPRPTISPHTAALRIQRAVRAHHHRREMTRALTIRGLPTHAFAACVRDGAVRCIQRAVRGRLAAARVARDLEGTLVIRGLGSAAYGGRVRSDAARRIQTAVRGFLERCREARGVAGLLTVRGLGTPACAAGVRDAAARALQAAVREFLARRAAARGLHDLLEIRGVNVHQEYTDWVREAAARRIQEALREYVAGGGSEARKTRATHAMQRALRECVCREAQRREAARGMGRMVSTWRRRTAAVLIQRCTRGYLARGELARRMEAGRVIARVLGSSWRRRQHRLAAITIQRHARGHLARALRRRMAHAGGVIARVAAAWWRRCQRAAAARMIQRRMRGYLARQRVRRALQARCVIARSVGAWWRHRRRSAAAVVIQRCARGRLARRCVASKHAAAQLLQSWWMGCTARRRGRHTTVAARRIQRATRRWLARRDAAARVVQKLGRSFVTKVWAAEETRAARVIQRMVRRPYTWRRRVAAARVIQNFMRTTTERLYRRRRYEIARRESTAAVRIQNAARQWLQRRRRAAVEREEARGHAAAARIQRVYRRWHAAMTRGNMQDQTLSSLHTLDLSPIPHHPAFVQTSPTSAGSPDLGYFLLSNGLGGDAGGGTPEFATGIRAATAQPRVRVLPAAYPPGLGRGSCSPTEAGLGFVCGNGSCSPTPIPQLPVVRRRCEVEVAAAHPLQGAPAAAAAASSLPRVAVSGGRTAGVHPSPVKLALPASALLRDDGDSAAAAARRDDAQSASLLSNGSIDSAGGWSLHEVYHLPKVQSDITLDVSLPSFNEAPMGFALFSPHPQDGDDGAPERASGANSTLNVSSDAGTGMSVSEGATPIPTPTVLLQSPRPLTRMEVSCEGLPGAGLDITTDGSTAPSGLAFGLAGASDAGSSPPTYPCASGDDVSPQSLVAADVHANASSREDDGGGSSCTDTLLTAMLSGSVDDVLQCFMAEISGHPDVVADPSAVERECRSLLAGPQGDEIDSAGSVITDPQALDAPLDLSDAGDDASPPPSPSCLTDHVEDSAAPASPPHRASRRGRASARSASQGESSCRSSVSRRDALVDAMISGDVDSVLLCLKRARDSTARRSESLGRASLPDAAGDAPGQATTRPPPVPHLRNSVLRNLKNARYRSWSWARETWRDGPPSVASSHEVFIPAAGGRGFDADTNQSPRRALSSSGYDSEVSARTLPQHDEGGSTTCARTPELRHPRSASHERRSRSASGIAGDLPPRPSRSASGDGARGRSRTPSVGPPPTPTGLPAYPATTARTTGGLRAVSAASDGDPSATPPSPTPPEYAKPPREVSTTTAGDSPQSPSQPPPHRPRFVKRTKTRVVKRVVRVVPRSAAAWAARVVAEEASQRAAVHEAQAGAWVELLVVHGAVLNARRGIGGTRASAGRDSPIIEPVGVTGFRTGMLEVCNQLIVDVEELPEVAFAFDDAGDDDVAATPPADASLLDDLNTSTSAPATGRCSVWSQNPDDMDLDAIMDKLAGGSTLLAMDAPARERGRLNPPSSTLDANTTTSRSNLMDLSLGDAAVDDVAAAAAAVEDDPLVTPRERVGAAGRRSRGSVGGAWAARGCPTAVTPGASVAFGAGHPRGGLGTTSPPAEDTRSDLELAISTGDIDAVLASLDSCMDVPPRLKARLSTRLSTSRRDREAAAPPPLSARRDHALGHGDGHAAADDTPFPAGSPRLI